MNEAMLATISSAEMPSHSRRRPQKSIAVWARIRRRQRLLATGRITIAADGLDRWS